MLHILVGPSNKFSNGVQRAKKTWSHTENPRKKYDASVLPSFRPLVCEIEN